MAAEQPPCRGVIARIESVRSTSARRTPRTVDPRRATSSRCHVELLRFDDRGAITGWGPVVRGLATRDSIPHASWSDHAIHEQNESLAGFAKNYQRELWRLVNKAPGSSFHSHATQRFTPRDHRRGRRPHHPSGMIAKHPIPELLPRAGDGDPGRDRRERT